VERLKVKAPSSSPSTAKRKKNTVNYDASLAILLSDCEGTFRMAL
jgi:hypothetical protein